MFKQKQPISVQEYSKKKVNGDLLSLQKKYDKLKESIEKHDDELHEKQKKLQSMHDQIVELVYLQKTLQ
jgi:prefoldin subunit 5